MATTPKIGIEKLEIGQGEKEATINTAFDKIDAAYGTTPQFMGDLTGDPSITNVPLGSTYFNTSLSKFKMLRGNSTWVTLN